MSNTLKFGAGKWAAKAGSVLAYNDENNNFKPLPFTFARASSATRVNESGLIESVASGVPRIDFLDNADGHLLLEPSRSNLLTYSEAFDNGSWTKSNATIIADQATAPDGNVSADKITISSNSGFIYKAPTLASGTQVAYSVFVKNVDAAYLNLQIRTATTSGLATFNFSESVLTDYVLTTGTSANFLDYGNGWYRCTLICTTSEANQLCRIQLPNASDSVYIWGAQLEAGSYATSYIPTSGSSVTMVADAAYNAGNTQVFNDSEGVLFLEMAAVNDSTAKRISISNNTNDENIYLSTGSIYTYAVISGGVAQAFITDDSAIVTDFNKIAMKYKTNDFALWVNGVEVGTDATGSTPTGLSELSFDRGTGSLNFYGRIKSVQVYNTALTDSELAALTS